MRAAEKKAKAQQRAAEKQAAEQPAEPEPKKKGLFGFGKKEEGRVGTAKQAVSPSRPSKTENKRVPARCPLAF